MGVGKIFFVIRKVIELGLNWLKKDERKYMVWKE